MAAIVQDSADAIVGKTTDGVIVDWNRGAELLYGYAAQEAVGQAISMLFPREISAREMQLTVGAACGERIEHYETRRVRQDGWV
jgi:two-component system, sensor histidine kinase and response regulator